MRYVLPVALGVTLSTLFIACASEEDKVDVYSPSTGGTDAGKGGSAGNAGKPSSAGAAGAPSTGGAAGQAGQSAIGGAAGQAGGPSNGGAAGAGGGAAGASGGAAGDGGSAGAVGGAAGDAGAAGGGGAAGSMAGTGGSPGTGGSAGAVDCWSTGYSGNCDPLNNDCSSGMACDLIEDWEGYLVLECVSDGPQKAGETCDDENGPYCADRLHCNALKGVCQKYCCTDGDCAGIGGTCKPIDASTALLGLCE